MNEYIEIDGVKYNILMYVEKKSDINNNLKDFTSMIIGMIVSEILLDILDKIDESSMK